MNNATPSTIASSPRKPAAAILLSIAATGLGHIYCGRLLKGLILFFASFAFAPIIVLTAQNASSPLMIALVLLSSLLMAGIFVYALIDAGLLARKTGRDYDCKEYNRWYVYLLFIVVGLTYPTNLASSIRENILQAFKIPSQNMAPGILPGDRILSDKTHYKIALPQKGDVVIFIHPDDRRKLYIRRIAALPGESVEIRDDVVYINGQPLSQHVMTNKPVLNFTPPQGAQIVAEDNGVMRYPVIISKTKTHNLAKMVVPHGQCFVLADNRAQTTDHYDDSRHFGPIPLADIKGRMGYIYWPAQSWSRFGPVGIGTN